MLCWKPYLFVDTMPGKGPGVFAGTYTGQYRDRVVARDRHGKKDRAFLDQTLHDYIFEGKNNEQCCMALGLGTPYNHNYKSNCNISWTLKKLIDHGQNRAVIEKRRKLHHQLQRRLG